MKLYLYCLAEHLEELTVPAGISGAKVEVRKLEGFSVLVSEFDEKQLPLNIENVLAHAAVVQTVFKDTTPLPFRYGSLVTEQQLRNYITSNRSDFEKKLAMVRGLVEMSVRIIGNIDPPKIETNSETGEPGPGTRFLKQKRQEILGGEARDSQVKEISAWLQDRLGPLVSWEHVSVHPGEKLGVQIAHLVSRELVTEYRDRLSEARKTRPELHFLVSGPWPPYTFCNIELEFKTRFGVS